MQPIRHPRTVLHCRLVQNSYTTSTAPCLALCLAYLVTALCQHFTLHFQCGVCQSRCRQCQQRRQHSHSSASTTALHMANDCIHVCIMLLLFFIYCNFAMYITLYVGQPTGVCLLQIGILSKWLNKFCLFSVYRPMLHCETWLSPKMSVFHSRTFF